MPKEKYVAEKNIFVLIIHLWQGVHSFLLKIRGVLVYSSIPIQNVRDAAMPTATHTPVGLVQYVEKDYCTKSGKHHTILSVGKWIQLSNMRKKIINGKMLWREGKKILG